MEQLNRRNLARLATIAAGTAALAGGMPLSANAAPPPAPSHMLGEVKQVEAGDLTVGYTDAGPADGRPVILLHGWPYDIHSYADVSAILAGQGFRVIVPYLRGFGPTRFLSPKAVRNGQQAALAHDLTALM